MPHGFLDLSPPTRVQTLAVRALSPSHWTTREFQYVVFYDWLLSLSIMFLGIHVYNINFSFLSKT